MGKQIFGPWSSRAIGTGVALALVVGLAGPAAASPSARQLLNNSWKHAEQAKSVTVAGSATQSGQTFALKVTINSKGDAKGWIALSGNRLYLVKIGSEGYFMGDANFWKSQGGTGATAASALFANRWLKASGSNSPLSGFDQYLGINAFFKQAPPSSITNLTLKNSTLHGQAVYAVHGTQGGQPGTIFVSKSTPNYPLQISSPGSGTFTFANWNGNVTIHAPKGAIDFNSLAG